MRDPRTSDAHARAAAIAALSLLDGGYLRIYDGPKPRTADAPARGTVLAELRFASPAFAVSRTGVGSARPIEPEPEAPATGRPRWFRALSAGEVAVFDGTVGTTEDSDIRLSEDTIEQGAEVVVKRLGYAAARA